MLSCLLVMGIQWTYQPIIYIIIINYLYISIHHIYIYTHFFKKIISPFCAPTIRLALQVHPLAAALLARSRGRGLRLVAKFGTQHAGSKPWVTLGFLRTVRMWKINKSTISRLFFSKNHGFSWVFHIYVRLL